VIHHQKNSLAALGGRATPVAIFQEGDVDLRFVKTTIANAMRHALDSLSDLVARRVRQRNVEDKPSVVPRHGHYPPHNFLQIGRECPDVTNNVDPHTVFLNQLTTEFGK
jgi:hypothetical protein